MTVQLRNENTIMQVLHTKKPIREQANSIERPRLQYQRIRVKYSSDDSYIACMYYDHERLKQAVKHLKEVGAIYSAVDIARDLGYKTASSVNNLMSGYSQITTKFVHAFCTRYGINKAYLQGEDAAMLPVQVKGENLIEARLQIRQIQLRIQALEDVLNRYLPGVCEKAETQYARMEKADELFRALQIRVEREGK